MQVQVVENVLKLNDEVAGINRRRLQQCGVFTLDILGAPGCGKTLLVEKTLHRLAGKFRLGVIVGDLATQRDADRMAVFSENVVQVNTGKGCHLEAHHITQAMERLDITKLDILIIENVGNLICPVGFDLGQDVKVGIFCTTGGDDKPAKHPYIVNESNLLILNKIDLLPYLPFRRDIFEQDIRRLNADVPLLPLSAHTGEGLDAWIGWIETQRAIHISRK